MKPAEKYENLFPLEPLLPDLNDNAVQDIVNNCDYTDEADRICDIDGIDNKVNIADAIVFYIMGYEAAREEINKKLKAAEL